MIPTLYQVYDLTRAVLGEHELPEDETEFDDAYLRRFARLGLEKLHAAFARRNLDFPEHRTYYVLPAHQDFWRPTLSGVSNCGIPTEVRSAEIDSTHTVTAATTAGTLTFSGAHGLSLGDRLGIYGVLGLRRGRYNDEHRVVTIPGSTQINVGDVEEVGSWTSGGKAVKFSNLSNPWSKIGSLDNVGSSVAADTYEWNRQALKLIPTDEDRLLQIVYRASGALPTLGEDLLGVDGSGPFLAYYTASKAASALGARQSAQDLMLEAVGHPQNSDADGGRLGDVVTQAIHALQDETFGVRRFRPRQQQNVWGYS